MTTRAPGLTAAMRRDLKLVLDGKAALVRQNRINRLMVSGFIDRSEVLTPRGHAALAAPRMAAAELALLVYLEGSLAVIEKLYSPTWRSCERKDWIDYNNEYECWDLTHPGLKALNDVRAATGSELYKDNMP